MFLDDAEKIGMMDSKSMGRDLQEIPFRIESVWKRVFRPAQPHAITKCILSGSQAFVAAGRLFQAYFKTVCDVPVLVGDWEQSLHYGLDESCLIVVNDAQNQPKQAEGFLYKIQERHARCVVLSAEDSPAEGNLPDRAETWVLPELAGNPDNVFVLFTALLSIAYRNGLLPDCSESISALCTEISALIEKIEVDSPPVRNFAKRMAGQMMDRLVILIGAGFLAPVAGWWKFKLNRIAKNWVQMEEIGSEPFLPALGVYFPEKILTQSVAVFLNSDLFDAELGNKVVTIRDHFLMAGLGTDQVMAYGDTVLSQTFNLLVFGEFVAYYLAIANNIDPSQDVNLGF